MDVNVTFYVSAHEYRLILHVCLVSALTPHCKSLFPLKPVSLTCCRARERGATHLQICSPHVTDVQSPEDTLQRHPEVLCRPNLQHLGEQGSQMRLYLLNYLNRNRRICEENKTAVTDKGQVKWVQLLKVSISGTQKRSWCRSKLQGTFTA